MDKSATLEALGAAKAAHIKWVNRARNLIDGIPVVKEAIPVDSTECAFGKWFYLEGSKLNAFGSMDCLSVIETYHFELHDRYLKIFTIYFGEDSRGFFSKLLNKKKKVTENDIRLARDYFEQLESSSKKLLDEITRLERRLHAISAESFASK